MPGFVPVVYSGGARVMRSDGVTQRVACPHLAQWLTVYDALQVFRGRGHVVYYQTQGTGVAASGPTHDCGSAFDKEDTGTAAIMDAREMGGALFPRLTKYGWNGAQHDHGLINCGDNGCNGYQYAAYLSGHNGLGLNGVGAGDPLPKPATIRTWQQGIVWAQAQMGASPMTQTTQEDDMATFIQVKGDPKGTVYITDGITARAVPDVKSLADLAFLAGQGVLRITQPVPGPTNPDVISVNGVYVRVVGNPGVIGKVI